MALEKQNSNSGAVIHSRPARISEEFARSRRLLRAQSGGAREGEIGGARDGGGAGGGGGGEGGWEESASTNRNPTLRMWGLITTPNSSGCFNFLRNLIYLEFRLSLLSVIFVVFGVGSFLRDNTC